MNAITRPTRMLMRVLLLVGAMSAPAGSSRAGAADESRLAPRLGSSVAVMVGSMLDEARKKGLPTEPLLATALEGAARKASAERIVSAVRSHAAALEIAARALDAHSSEAEIAAGASAFRAGVAPDSLARLRATRRGSLVVPLVVMADMVARGVDPAAASAAVIAASRRGVSDGHLLRLREHVAQDIRAGATPGDAARVRTQALLIGMEGAEPDQAAPRRLRPPGVGP
jgi:hypothetical protein